jgi:phage head maturation protease
MVITGLAAPYDVPAYLGHGIYIRFLAGAFDWMLGMGSVLDVDALIEHRQSRFLGMWSDGSLEIWCSAAGLHYAICPWRISDAWRHAVVNVLEHFFVGASVRIDLNMCDYVPVASPKGVERRIKLAFLEEISLTHSPRFNCTTAQLMKREHFRTRAT